MDCGTRWIPGLEGFYKNNRETYIINRKGRISVRRYPAFSLILEVLSQLSLADSEHFSAASRTYALGCRFTVFHRNRFSIFHFLFGFTFYTIGLHVFSPPFTVFNIKDKPFS
jgi:hypothetical protein